MTRTPAEHLSEREFAIFLFHGVVRSCDHPVRNYTRKHLPVEDFTSTIAELCRVGRAVSMDDIVAAAEGRADLPSHAFAVTFDDGFENNLTVAAPVLESFMVPATFYITTGFIERNGASWIDMVEYAVEETAVVRLSLQALSLSGSWSSATEKQQLLEDVRTIVKQDRRIDPYDVAAEIWRQLGVEGMVSDRGLDQKLSWSQICQLDRHPLFMVGGHSHTHRVLEFLEDAALDSEIATSLDLLRRQLGRPVTHYSYPEGLAHCFSDRVIASLRRHGVVCSPSAMPGVNAVGGDLFRLLRIPVT